MTKAKTKDPENDCHLNLKLRTSDGARFSTVGDFPNRTTFAVYMLVCNWGDGKSHKPLRKKVDKDFEAAARTFLEAAQTFYDKKG